MQIENSAIMKNLQITSFYYIHGFASGKSSTTFQKIKERIPQAKALTFDSSKSYQENIKSLASQVANDKEPACVIGTSLGGFYAMQLTPFVHYCAGRVLINPSVKPKSSLRKFIGECPNFETGSTFVFTEEVCNSYPEELDKRNLMCSIPTGVLLARDDELLDYHLAEEVFDGYTGITYISGGHRLKDFDALFKEIKGVDYCALV